MVKIINLKMERNNKDLMRNFKWNKVQGILIIIRVKVSLILMFNSKLINND